jgi:hypothetical protein
MLGRRKTGGSVQDIERLILYPPAQQRAALKRFAE